MTSTKCEGLSYPTHFLKSRGSVIRNNFFEYRSKQSTLFARRNGVYSLFATNKAKHILIRHFRAFVVTQFIVKVKRKFEKKSPIFESLPFPY